jgi:7-carboxy-7-deazaguanine synthase
MGLPTDKLPILEEFVSIQGEGRNIGKPYYFIRVGGCPLRCNFCDSEYTWTPTAESIMDVEGAVDRAIEACAVNNIEWVSITGGEPMIYPKQMVTFIRLLKEKSKHKLKVHIETSGRFYDPSVHVLCDIYSPDAKTPCTGESMDGFFQGLHGMRPKDQVKCLISNEDDLNYANRVNKALAGICPTILQPFNQEIATDSVANMDPAIAATRNMPGEDGANPTVMRRAMAVSLRWLLDTFHDRCSKGERWQNVIITPQIHVLAYGNTPST